MQALRGASDRPLTMLDGDVVRRNLSSELGFSKVTLNLTLTMNLTLTLNLTLIMNLTLIVFLKEHRDLNIRRIGYVASEITKARGSSSSNPNPNPIPNPDPNSFRRLGCLRCHRTLY